MKTSKKNIIVGVLIVIFLWALSALLISTYLEPEKRGTFGDMFGAINSLFSGLALFGIIVSILIQQKELNHQKKELIDTRLEFRINRITTIMFKQLDNLNLTIDKHLFSTTDIKTGEITKLNIEEFLFARTENLKYRFH